MSHLNAMLRIREDLAARLEACDWAIRQLKAIDAPPAASAGDAARPVPPAPPPPRPAATPPAAIKVDGRPIPAPTAAPPPRIEVQLGSTKTDQIVALLAASPRPMTTREIAEKLGFKVEATSALVDWAHHRRLVETAGTRPTSSGGRPARLWRAVGVTKLPPADTDTPIHETPRPDREAPKPVRETPRQVLGPPDPAKFPHAPRKGQVWQGSGQTRIVSGVVFNPESPDSYLVNYTQVPGAAILSSYRTSWERWAESARCIKEPSC